MTRAASRDFARAELARWEYWYRTQAHGLDKAVEADADRLLAHGVETDTGATQEERRAATLAAWQRVDEGRTRAAGLRLVARVLRRVLGALGGEPIYDRDAVPETVRQARVGMFVERQEERAEAAGARTPAHAPGDLTKEWLVQHAESLGPDLVYLPHEHIPGCTGTPIDGFVCLACHDKGAMVEAAEKHGIMQESEHGWPTTMGHDLAARAR